MTTLSDHGRALAARRWETVAPVEKVCAHCGKKFSTKQTQAVYCCQSCRQMAYQRREAARKRAKKEGE